MVERLLYRLGYVRRWSHDPDAQLAAELLAVIEAGDQLAAAAHRVQATHDGVHRLRLALARWYVARADEWGRGTST